MNNSKTMCVLFSESYSAATNELAAERTLATVPFAGRYRLVDFMLSSLVKAGVGKVGIVTKEHYGSLVDHIGSGKNWDLDRKNGGMKILTPFAKAGSEATRTRSKIDALLSIQTYLEESTEDTVILADTNIVMNIDFEDMVKYHNAKGADITIAYKSASDAVYNGLVIDNDKEGKVIDAYHAAGKMSDTQNQVIKVFVFNKALLLNLLDRAYTFGWTDFERDFITKNIGKLSVYGYETSGYCAVIDTVADLYKASMEILCPCVRRSVFESGTPILTRVKNSPPTIYGFDSKVGKSLIADGCQINGVVENSIISRGVTIEAGAVVKNCVIMSNTVVKAGAELDCIIADKDCVISEGRKLSGYPTFPFVISKGKTV